MTAIIKIIIAMIIWGSLGLFVKNINLDSFQSAAFLGYIDPVYAIFFSVVFLKEYLSIWQVIGEKPSKKEEVV